MQSRYGRQDKTRINNQIRAAELRVVDTEEGNLGVMTRDEALKKATERGLDLIEISPNATPPIAKIMDFGKYQYEQNKKNKTRGHFTETKTLQVKIGTGEHDLALKSKQASKFLKEGNRVKIDLFLAGRAKYLEKTFLTERLDRILHLITEDYKVADGPKRSPKGLSVVIEKK
ncbi:MAG: translation initiation factor IF-3 [Candidatus Liptonbacteria bacterium RIFCSPLOWO2_01_FULL_52_25]|uniref:Translation initiation factor IF-3 n=1 Tax=Candidatus Liptonbacteria bacterium RIFCSPLOWO2_01_FULL_52_25 TaxID=1798650 RepID=A0A1G2CCG2_9BACT|nr:MAG: translation initiation factor IF-3 [Candidatus Liptonbacteria bacterium RIFCSPLOWO2_01_FULL_52_25]